MKRECDRIGDAIWEHVRFGAELPADVQAHIAGCAECARAMDEARKLSGIVQAVARTPDAPDCTDAVMTRISAVPRSRPVWAYAAGILAVLAISGLLLIHPHGARQPQIAHEDVAPVTQTPQKTPYTPPAPKHEIQPAIQPRGETAQSKPATAVYHRPRVRHRIDDKAMLAKADHPKPQAPTLGDSVTLKEQPEPERRPIAAVAVTWSKRTSPSTSYAYRETNETTGETTTCRVERSPGSVSIFMESKPGGRKPPSEGI